MQTQQTGETPQATKSDVGSAAMPSSARSVYGNWTGVVNPGHGEVADYLACLDAARDAIKRHDPLYALDAARQALVIRPNDVDALRLLRSAQIHAEHSDHVRREEPHRDCGFCWAASPRAYNGSYTRYGNASGVGETVGM